MHAKFYTPDNPSFSEVSVFLHPFLEIKALTFFIELERRMACIQRDSNGPHGSHSLHQGLFPSRDAHEACDVSHGVLWIVATG